tara:strand:- start:1377 stop:2786 length:1410 start_codon:yes stop_codon:yes gene_type:complete
MSDNFKRSRIGIFGYVPEVTQGKRCFKLKATGGSSSSLVVSNAVSTGFDNENLTDTPTDFFKGLQLYGITGSNAGKILDITSQTYSLGSVTFNFATAGIVSAGHTFYLLGRLPASNVSITSGKENLTREEFVRPTLDRPSSLKGLSTVSGSFDMELCGHATGTDASTVALPVDAYSAFFSGIGTRAAGGGATVASGASSSVFDVGGGEGARFAVGDFVMVNNEVAKITNISTDTLTVAPAFSDIPAGSDVVYGAEYYTPDDTGHRSFTFVHLADDQLWTYSGCVYSLSFSGDFGALTSASVEFTGEDYSVDTASVTGFSFDNPSPTTVPFVTGRATVNDGSSDIALYIGSVEFDYGNGIELTRDTNENQQAFIITRESTLGASLRDRNESAFAFKNQATGIEALGTKLTTTVQVGNVATKCVGVHGKTQFQDPASMSDRNGINYYDVNLWFCDDSTDVINPTKPIFFRF